MFLSLASLLSTEKGSFATNAWDRIVRLTLSILTYCKRSAIIIINIQRTTSMNLYHFVLVALSFSYTASADRRAKLREVAASDLSTSDASPSLTVAAPDHQQLQTMNKPQCALDVASLNRGDVQMELPGGKVGFEKFPNCTTIFSSKFLDEIGVDHSTCIMSVPQLTKAAFTISRFRDYMP